MRVIVVLVRDVAVPSCLFVCEAGSMPDYIGSSAINTVVTSEVVLQVLFCSVEYFLADLRSIRAVIHMQDLTFLSIHVQLSSVSVVYLLTGLKSALISRSESVA